MPTPVRTPRVNNNDDTVRVAALLVEPGASVRPGDAVAEIETDKATFSVEADQEGFLLRFLAAPGDVVEVGSVLAWLGAKPDETAPDMEPASTPTNGAPPGEPTLKAEILLVEFGLDAAQVPASGPRLTAADVRRFVAERGLRVRTAAEAAPAVEPPESPGRLEALNPEQRAMLRTVLWHRDQASAGYVELPYDPRPWNDYAAAFQKRHGLLLSPLLGLLSHRLVAAAVEQPNLNAAIVNDQRYVYEAVNLGFTVQSGDTLFLAVIRDADKLDAKGFVERLAEAQRAAMRGALPPEQARGATLGFTSMARWGVSRHVPMLPPYVSLMAAHSAARDGAAVLGATYDHRLLTGFDVVRALRLLSGPPSETSA